MKRAAIIIEASQVDELNDLNGARKDARNWNNYLLSDVGGAWDSNDILVLHTPKMKDVFSAIASTSVDYLFVAFSGHGGIENGREVICLGDGNCSTNLLKKIICEQCPKATLVLDCCRSGEENVEVQVERSRSLFDSIYQTRASHRDEAAYCKTGPANYSEMSRGVRSPQKNYMFSSKWFESVLHSSVGLLTMWACSRGESAGEDSSTTSNKGGYFTTALIKAALKWNKQTPIPYLIYTTRNAFVDSYQFMHDPQQNPEYDPEWLAFPFAVSTL